MHRILLILTVTLLSLGQSIALPPTAAGKDPKGIAFFEKRIRPLLAEHCYECHSESGKIKGGLSLDTEAGWMDGGDSGEVIVLEKPSESLLLKAISHKDSDLQMPPKYKLSEAEIEALTRWVKMGAPDPRDGTPKKAPKTEISIEEGRKFWAFQPPTKSKPPAPSDQKWKADPIDQFVYAALTEKGLKPVAEADRRTLIRRASFDLIGLPPTPKEIDAFVKDPAPQQQAFAKVVDRLLASPHFGERWGRHWMDLARYAESMGRTRNWPFPFAWRYRDYVIDAFNSDMRYNRFLAEQLAGDLLPAKDDAQKDRQLIATGFLTLGSMDLNERDAKVYKADQIDEQIDVTARSILGLTVACARCHDHKFDPIPTADYYALAGIFGSTEVRNGLKNKGGGGGGYLNANSFAKLHQSGQTSATKPAAQPDNDRRLAKLRKEAQTIQAQIKKLSGNKKAKKSKELKDLRNAQKKLTDQIARLNKNKKGGGNAKLSDDLVMAATEANKPINWRINIKGDPKNLGAEIERGVPKVLIPEQGHGLTFPPNASGRLELAKWITTTEHPLTSRVMVNRIWHHLFGQGIVRTVDNFGETGERPSNRALLDHLALRFAEDNAWSVKRTIRDIMLTRTYQLGSDFDQKNFLADPENRLHWRANVRRLEAEAIRDSLLAISGNLDRSPMSTSPVHRMKGAEIGRNAAVPNGTNFAKRSIYMPIIRNYVPPVLETFDFAEPSAVIGRRDVTTVSTQALYMMNNPFVLKQAKAAADRIQNHSADPFARVQAIYLTALGRRATKEEVDRAVAYVNTEGDKGWPALFQAVFASSEFRYLQ